MGPAWPFRSKHIDENSSVSKIYDIPQKNRRLRGNQPAQQAFPFGFGAKRDRGRGFSVLIAREIKREPKNERGGGEGKKGNLSFLLSFLFSFRPFFATPSPVLYLTQGSSLLTLITCQNQLGSKLANWEDLTALKQHLVNRPFSPRLFCLFLFCFVYIYIYFSGDSTPIRLLVELATTLKY